MRGQRFFALPSLASVSLLGASSLIAACNTGSTPLAMSSNSANAEVPRDQDDPNAPAKPASTVQPAILVADSPPIATESSYTAPLPAQTSSTPQPRTKSKGATGKVTVKECGEMIDRYLDLTIAGPGGPLADMSGKDLEESKARLKALAASDKSFGSLQSTCEKTATRSQYDCAMGAPTSHEWQNCVR